MTFMGYPILGFQEVNNVLTKSINHIILIDVKIIGKYLLKYSINFNSNSI